MILALAIEIGGPDGAVTHDVACRILDHESSSAFLPSELRALITVNKVQSDDEEKLKSALSQHRAPIGVITMYENQFDAVFRADTFGIATSSIYNRSDSRLVADVIESKHIPAAAVEARGRQDIASHAVVLTSFDEDSGTWRFKNSWGEKWGIKGEFILSSPSVLDTMHHHPTFFIDFAFDLTGLPADNKYVEAFSKYHLLEADFDPPMPVLQVNSEGGEDKDMLTFDLASGKKMQIGSGASSKVYRGSYAGRACAIKVLLSQDKQPRELRFAFDHPNLTKTFAYKVKDIEFEDAKTYEVAIELQEYGTLTDVQGVFMSLLSPLKLLVGASMLLDIADALVHLHSIGITHGDICDANILFGGDFRTKLSDFGSLSADQLISKTIARGHPGWFEIEAADQPVTRKWDIYSFGVLISHLLGVSRTSASLGFNRPSALNKRLFELMKRCFATVAMRPKAQDVFDELMSIVVTNGELSAKAFDSLLTLTLEQKQHKLFIGLFMRLALRIALASSAEQKRDLVRVLVGQGEGEGAGASIAHKQPLKKISSKFPFVSELVQCTMDAMIGSLEDAITAISKARRERGSSALPPPPPAVSKNIIDATMANDVHALLVLCREWAGTAAIDGHLVKGSTALLAAVRMGRVDCLRVLIASGANMLFATEGYAMNALHVAAQFDQTAVCSVLLLKEECLITGVTMKNVYGKTPAEWAHVCKSLACEALLTNAQTAAEVMTGKPPKGFRFATPKKNIEAPVDVAKAIFDADSPLLAQLCVAWAGNAAIDGYISEEGNTALLDAADNSQMDGVFVCSLLPELI